MDNIRLEDGEKIIWSSNRHILSFKYPFTKYTLTTRRLFVEDGVFNYRCEEIKLFRVKDTSITMNILEKLCGTGTIEMKSADSSAPSIFIKGIYETADLRQAINHYVEIERQLHGMSSMEFVM